MLTTGTPRKSSQAPVIAHALIALGGFLVGVVLTLGVVAAIAALH